MMSLRFDDGTTALRAMKNKPLRHVRHFVIDGAAEVIPSFRHAIQAPA
jgi:hypothetical protein